MLVRRKQNWWRDPSIITTIQNISIFTGGLVWVGIQQSVYLTKPTKRYERESELTYILWILSQPDRQKLVVHYLGK